MPTSRFAALALSLAPAITGWAAAPASLPALDRVYVNPEPAPIADFTLTDQDGKALAFSSLRGQPLLVFFGFTHCPSICPTTLARLKSLHASRNGALEPARIVLVSVDGDRDTPGRLKTYLAALSPEFIGLTGDAALALSLTSVLILVLYLAPMVFAGKEKAP
jgi:cytochrome oxidase Cu insertion factor (SCO1/SenC/PrrC family)